MNTRDDMAKVIHRRETCRACGSRDLDLVFSLKPTPIGDAYVTADRLNVPQPSFPIDLHMCRACGLAQLLDVIDPNVLYGEYIYVTASSMGLGQHFARYARDVVARCKLPAGSLVVDLGSNDGTLLREFKGLGMQVLGVEPASHIAAQASAAGVPTLPRFFNADLSAEIVAASGHPRVVTANNVFANIDDLDSWVRAIDKLLPADGVFVFESFYLADVVKNMVFDFIYHEHLSAFSVKPMRMLFASANLQLAAVERVPTKGGSLRYFVQRHGGPVADDGSVAGLEASEEEAGLYRKETYAAFARKVDALKSQTVAFLERAKKEGKSVAGFGASITGTTLIYHFEIGQYLDYLIDDNSAKQGRFTPGLHLPVLPTEVIYERKPDIVVALAWRFAKAFIEKNQAFLDAGGQCVVPVPEFRTVGGDR
jgi:hypothetical protein